ncbi:MAG: hypothetical protein FK734_08555 [Asgard group archaeon]|nr:hypothetical protein [Asgard group archaeon]
MKLRYVFVIILVVIITLGTSGFLVYYFKFNPGLFTPCEEKPFTSYPVDMDRLTSIVPLGNLNPPGHTYPTDHMYFFTNSTYYIDGFEIFSPGNITITLISKVEYNPAQIAGVTQDYTIDFVVCSAVSGRFGHINNISTFLSDITGEFGDEYGDEESSYEIDGRIYTNYKKRITIDVPSGQLLGRAGIGGGGYDFWLKDSRVTLEWVNNDISSSFQHTVCPLNYFVDSLKNVMITKLNAWGGIPVYPPGYCGRIAFDVAGTAQGIWKREGWSGNEAEERGLSLVYSNLNASMGAISIGNAENDTWDKRAYYFSPAESGFRNRNFSQVTPDGNIYYYFCNEFTSGSDYTKVILIKMTAERELYLHFIDTGGIPLPSDPSSLFDQMLAVKYIR